MKFFKKLIMKLVNDETKEVENFENVEEGEIKNYFLKKNPPKLNNDEMDILKITHDPNFMNMLREEFERNPIDYKKAQEETEMEYQNSFK